MYYYFVKSIHIYDTIATVSNTVSNHFIKSDGFIPLLNNISADTVKSAGMYYIQNTTGTPQNANGFLFVLPVSNSYAEQQFCSVAGEKYIRTCNNGTWTAWQKLATETSISVPVGSDGLVPVSSNEHAILIMVGGWSNQVNGYAWICTGYVTGSNRKVIVNIGRTDMTNVTCTAAETGYTIHNGANATANVHIIYLMNN